MTIAGTRSAGTSVNDWNCSCCALDPLTASASGQSTRRLWLVLGLLILLWIAELSIGSWSHSLSLLADAGHLFADVGALLLTLAASWFARRPAAGRATFGHWRVELLAALANGFGLLAIAALIAWEAVERFHFPEPVLSLPLLLGAGLGLLVNGLNLKLLHKHSAHDLNLQGAFLHVVADVASSVGILVAALVIYGLHWLWIDAVASLMIACLTGLSALPLIWNSLEVLLNYAPRSVDPALVREFLESSPGVCQVQKLHIWSIASNRAGLCAQLAIKPLTAAERDRLQSQLQAELSHAFGIQDSTLQLTNRFAIGAETLHPLLEGSLRAQISTTTTTTLSGLVRGCQEITS
ncbi:cation diffusion facilitator family transporter [Stenomitos frigidus]|uniref:Cation transporter n=1 Tax=Stenomitos frigidus ULC18 TaxID=2107698 RepID=A0A2T1EPS7_9CYAN|nr:cation diffusion facilitator family transporter [Stenomitos frigidus]PSB34668.1 cation transporter [Stenomitos frigidus ULC18]